ncbi:MAG: N-acetyltransferase [Bdellovibrionia bacterium]
MKKSGEIIRKLGAADAALWRELRLEMLRDTPTAFGKSYEEELANPPSFYEERFKGGLWDKGEEGITGAFVAGELVGTAGFFQNTGMKHRHEGTIWGVYVKPTCRGMGISNRVLQDVVRRARLHPHIEQISLTVEASNKYAVDIYSSLGFKLWGTHPRCLKLGDRYYDEHYMLLVLKS